MPRRRPRSGSGLLLLALACLGSGPCAMFPGGRIDGTPAAPPQSWDVFGSGTQCDLEVNPPAPKSVFIDCYTHEGQLYVHSHRWARTPRLWGEAWVTAAEREPDVRLGVAGRIYELRAELVTDASLREQVLVARGFDPVPQGIQLFALHGRPAP